jgi:rhodanese-related sulfurtransferase
MLPATLPGFLLGYTTMPMANFQPKLLQGFFGLLIDTRAQSEWNAGHLPNATFMENIHATGDVSSILGCRSCNVAVYCHSGFRSQQAAGKLEAAGFTSVFDVQGIQQWQAAGHALVSTASIQTACSKAPASSAICAWPQQAPSPPPLPFALAALISPPPPMPPPDPLPPPPLAPPPALATGALVGIVVGGSLGAVAITAAAIKWLRGMRLRAQQGPALAAPKMQALPELVSTA